MCISAQYYVSRLQSPLSLNWLRRLCGLRERLEIRPRRRGYVVDTVIVVVVVAAIVRYATVAGGRCVGVEAGVRVRQDRRQRRPLDDLLRDRFHRRGRSDPRRDTFSASLPSSELGSGELAAISRRGHDGVMLLRVTLGLFYNLFLARRFYGLRYVILARVTLFGEDDGGEEICVPMIHGHGRRSY